MDPQRVARAQQIFGDAIELPAAERGPYVATACGSDDGLRAEVESLLASIDEAGGFLLAPTGHERPDAASLAPAAATGRSRPGSVVASVL